MRSVLYMCSLIPAWFVIFGNTQGGNWTWGNFIFTFGILSLVDALGPHLKRNEETPYLSWLAHAFLILHIFLVPLSIFFFLRGITLKFYTGWELLGALLSTATYLATGGIIVAHELIHKKAPVLQLMGHWLLYLASNHYFAPAHLRIHHRYVGTEYDPTTARVGESLYKFALRSILGQLKQVNTLEVQRIKNQKSSVLSHHLVRGYSFTVVTLVALFFTFGPVASVCFALMGLIANILLESTNYIEHYGLKRENKAPISERLSWDCQTFASRFFLFDLPRHSHHHIDATVGFDKLRYLPNSPVLPMGYASMTIIAFIPFVFKPIMEQRMQELKLGLTQ